VLRSGAPWRDLPEIFGPYTTCTLGVNYAGFGDWVLLGFEGDFDCSGAKGSTGCAMLLTGAVGTTCLTRIDRLTTFRFRAGYTWSHFLIYATAGGAAGDFRMSDSNGSSQNPSLPLGWTAGVGVEYLFNDAVSAKVEYLFVDLTKVTCPATILCSIDNSIINDGMASFTQSLIRVGVNYTFSW
jgi:outer membrane immunogenic protein